MITTISLPNIHHHTQLIFSGDENFYIYSLVNLKMCNVTINCSQHAVHYISMTYSVYNWKSVPWLPSCILSFPHLCNCQWACFFPFFFFLIFWTTDWLKIEKGEWPGYLLSPCLFNWYAEHIMRNAGLNELQAGIKMDGRNINNLTYVDDTTFKTRKWRGTKEPPDEGEGGEWKSWLKTNIKKN